MPLPCCCLRRRCRYCRRVFDIAAIRHYDVATPFRRYALILYAAPMLFAMICHCQDIDADISLPLFLRAAITRYDMLPPPLQRFRYAAAG